MGSHPPPLRARPPRRRLAHEPPGLGSAGSDTAAAAVATTTPSALPPTATALTIEGYTYTQDGVARLLERLSVIPDLEERPAPEQPGHPASPARTSSSSRSSRTSAKEGVPRDRPPREPAEGRPDRARSDPARARRRHRLLRRDLAEALDGRQPEEADGGRAGADRRQPLDRVPAGAAGGALRERLRPHAGDAEQARDARRDPHAEPARPGVGAQLRPDLSRRVPRPRPRPARRTRSPSEPITVKFSGSYYSLLTLLQRMRNLVRVQNGKLFTAGRLFDVSDVSFGQGQKGWPQVAATLTINEFVPQTATATAPATTGTRLTPRRRPRRPRRRPVHVGRPEHERRNLMRSRKKRMEDIRVAKDKKMKKVAIGLSVVLVAVLAFEVPTMLHSGGGGSAATPPATTTTALPHSRRPPRRPGDDASGRRGRCSRADGDEHEAHELGPGAERRARHSSTRSATSPAGTRSPSRSAARP